MLTRQFNHQKNSKKPGDLSLVTIKLLVANHVIAELKIHVNSSNVIWNLLTGQFKHQNYSKKVMSDLLLVNSHH